MYGSERGVQRVPSVVACGSAVVLVALLLWAVGQPIFTDDLWWHLAYGHAFAEGGPRLALDPLLYDAAGPPLRGSWLADIALAGVSQLAGWRGLRALHVALVAAILGLAWSALRRAGASRAGASVGAGLFVALSAYRLVQLRPELLTILFCLLLHRWLLAGERPPRWGAVAATAALTALWANVHAAFPLALLLPGAALTGLALARPLRTPSERRSDHQRTVRLAAALAVAALAALANPGGPGAYRAYFEAGGATPALERVSDEWASTSLFTWPALPALPSPLAWTLVWALVLATAWQLYRVFTPGSAGERRPLPDPASVGLSLLSLALMLSAVRFLWLGLFPLLLLARCGRAGAAAEARHRWSLAVAAAVLVPAFVFLGDWSLVTRGLPRTARGYAEPYQVGKYHAHAIWLLRDSGMQGHLYQDYFLGGFAGYWLAPELRSLVNGTLNVKRGTLDALAAIASRRGEREGEDFAGLLDRLDLDLFLGIHTPSAGGPGRRGIATTAHLEDTPGWIPVFRNLDSALYLRKNERNRDNLDRLARYYTERGVPFDQEKGFEAKQVIERAPRWAAEHGVIPLGYERTAHRARTGHDPRARDAIATVAALLGDYQDAVAIDQTLLRHDADAVRVRRRLAWSLLRLGRDEEARAVAAPLADLPASDGLSHAIAEVASAAATLDPQARRSAVATLPFLSHEEAGWILSRTLSATPRPPRYE
jgi:hypothetical protein